MKTSKVTDLARQGWKDRRRRTADARIVRVIDLSAHSPASTRTNNSRSTSHRDNLSHMDAARVVGCSIRRIDYLLPAARARLTEILDRYDLL